MDKFFFPLRDGYYFGRRLNEELKSILGNKLVQDSHATGLLAQTIVYAGHGDYIEIGSLHGGSAITVALVKKEFNLTGDIFCIEPHPRKILQNAKEFGVRERILTFKKTSEEMNWDNFTGFNCGLIDGDHRYPHPSQDWDRLKPLVSNYILFDDCDKSEIGVVDGVEQAIIAIDWRLVHFSNAIAIFENQKGHAL